MIAGDTFVHHIGSVSMKRLGTEGFAAVNRNNEHFFQQKWGNFRELLKHMKEGKEEPPRIKSTDFYPTHVWVEGCLGKRFWLEHGVKYPLSDSIDERLLPEHSVRLSVIDLLQIPTGAGPPPINIADIGAGLREGAVVQTGDGKRYQLDRKRLREIVSTYTCEIWGLPVEDAPTDPELLERYGEGPPILPPPYLRSEDL